MIALYSLTIIVQINDYYILHSLCSNHSIPHVVLGGLSMKSNPFQYPVILPHGFFPVANSLPHCYPEEIENKKPNPPTLLFSAGKHHEYCKTQRNVPQLPY